MSAAELLRTKWGKNLRRIRREADLTQEALAHRVGVDQSTVSRIETGDLRVLDPDLMLRFAIALEVDPEVIFEWPLGIRAIAAAQAS